MKNRNFIILGAKNSGGDSNLIEDLNNQIKDLTNEVNELNEKLEEIQPLYEDDILMFEVIEGDYNNLTLLFKLDGVFGVSRNGIDYIYYKYDGSVMVNDEGKFWLRIPPETKTTDYAVMSTDRNVKLKVSGALKNAHISRKYMNLFYNLVSNAEDLILDFDVIEEYGLSNLFNGSLEVPPREIRANLVKPNGVSFFMTYTKCTTIPNIYIKKIVGVGCSSMFNDNNNLVDLRDKVIKFEENVDKQGIFQNIFSGCDNLAHSPLIDYPCYDESFSWMFNNLQNLHDVYTTIKVISDNTPYNVVNSSYGTLHTKCSLFEVYFNLPSGWSVEGDDYDDMENNYDIIEIQPYGNAVTFDLQPSYNDYFYKLHTSDEIIRVERNTTITLSLDTEILTLYNYNRRGANWYEPAFTNIDGDTKFMVSFKNIHSNYDIITYPYFLYGLKKYIHTCYIVENNKYWEYLVGQDDADRIDFTNTTTELNCKNIFYNSYIKYPKLTKLTYSDDKQEVLQSPFVKDLTYSTHFELDVNTNRNYRNIFSRCRFADNTFIEFKNEYISIEGLDSTFSNAKGNNITIKLHLITPLGFNVSPNWLNHFIGTGTVMLPESARSWAETMERNTSTVPENWNIVYYEDEEPEKPNDNEDILVIENVDEVEGTVFMRNPNNIAIQYSTDGESFNNYTAETEVSIKPSEKVYFKWSDVIGKYALIGVKNIVNSTVKYKVYGELKKGNNENAYYYMFQNNSNLIDASELKLTSSFVNTASYGYMFSGCTNLTTAPAILPATVLSESCYFGMFQGCTNLTTAPELLATELPAGNILTASYGLMFSGCTNLDYVKHHITEWNTTSASNWLKNVAPSGTVECPANSTIPCNSASGIPSGWTVKPIEPTVPIV